MNVLHISANYPPMIGGPASSVPYIAEEQIKLGYKIYILTSGIDNKEPNIFRCNISSSNMLSNLLKALKMGLIGRKIIKKYPIDIIHVHDPNISALAHFIIDPFNKIPSIVKYSGDISIELTGKIYKPLIILERLIFKIFTKIQVQSNWNKKFLKEHCKIPDSKIIFIRNGINFKPFIEIFYKNPTPVIVSACRLEKWKGLENSIKVMKYIDAIYLIVGEGKEKNNLERLIKEENLSNKVKLMNRIPYIYLHKFLSMCDLMIVPSTYEPFSIAILDGFVSGIPVIGSDIGGIPELLEPEQLFNPHLPEDIVLKIYHALNNKDKLVKIQNEKLKNYTWDKIIKDLDIEYTMIA